MIALAKVKPPKLLRYDAMCRAIAECHSVDDAKAIRDKAVALAAYAREALNRENERQCCEIRIRAERRSGELLRETAKTGERATHKDGASSRAKRLDKPTLADHGISKDQSSDWQKLASIPKKRFEQELKKPGVPSTGQILANVYPPKKFVSPIKDVSQTALAAWGWIIDFENHKLLEAEPGEFVPTMVVTMREDCQRLCPTILSWMGKLRLEVNKNDGSA